MGKTQIHTAVPVFPNVEELGPDEQGDVVRRDTDEDSITSAIERFVVRAVYLFACRQLESSL